MADEVNTTISKWEALKSVYPAEIQSLLHYIDRHGINREALVSLNDDQVANAFNAWVKGEAEKFDKIVKR